MCGPTNAMAWETGYSTVLETSEFRNEVVWRMVAPSKCSVAGLLGWVGKTYTPTVLAKFPGYGL